MSYPHTIRAGLESLMEIEQLLKQFSDEGSIPSIDLDLILQKTRNLYDVLLLLRQYQADPASKPAEAGNIKVTPTEQLTTTVKNGGEPAQTGDTRSLKHEDEGRDRKFLSEKFAVRPSVYDSIHENAVQKSGATLAHPKPVNTILSAIGINDRYTFIRELFNNDSAAFERTIIRLDDSGDFNTAYNLLINQFDWDMDSELVQVLLDVIRRKYIKTRDE